MHKRLRQGVTVRDNERSWVMLNDRLTCRWGRVWQWETMRDHEWCWMIGKNNAFFITHYHFLSSTIIHCHSWSHFMAMYSCHQWQLISIITHIHLPSSMVTHNHTWSWMITQDHAWSCTITWDWGTTHSSVVAPRVIAVRAQFFMSKFSPYSTNSTIPISSSNFSLDYHSRS